MSGTHASADNPERYRLNEPTVIADMIDGEAVIMNLERGSYYSLDQIGSEIWRLIVGGMPPSKIADALADHYGVEREQTGRDIASLAAQMTDEDLIVAEAAPRVQAIDPPRFMGAVYAAPMLTIYGDMKDLLALDPPLPEFKSSVNQ